jgi:hypothetical protein
MGRPNPQNFSPLSAEEARRRGKNGGKKSVEVRRQRKAMRETLLELLQLPAEKRPEMSNEQAGLFAMLERWQKGDVSAGIFIRDTIGEKPTDKIDNTSSDGSMTPRPAVNVDLSNLTPQEVAKMARAAFRGEAED